MVTANTAEPDHGSHPSGAETLQAIEAMSLKVNSHSLSTMTSPKLSIPNPELHLPLSPATKDLSPRSRRLFSLPDPPSGLISPVASPTYQTQLQAFQTAEQESILQGGPITQIHNCRVVRNHVIEHDDVWFQDGRIIDPTALYGLRNPDARIDAKGMIISPGLVDVQLNGAFGYDFTFNSDNIDKCLDVVSRGVLLQGCTSFCPTMVSSTPENYHKVLPHLGKRSGSLSNGAESLGAHIEGPFMNPIKKGAHELACLSTAPNGIADFAKCYGMENLKHNVTYMTVAPEVEGVLDAIPQLIEECNIGISQGHSVASHEIARKAQQNGAGMITHLFNAMTNFHHRDPGIIGLLGNSASIKTLPSGMPNTGKPIFYGVICDGIHVHPNSVKIAYRSHPAGVVLVTDAMGAMGLPNGQYKLGNMSVDVGPTDSSLKESPRAAFIQGTNTLAGSIVTLIECVRNFKKFTQCSIVEAIEAATLHPAQMLGIEHIKGTLNYGADADIIFLTEDLVVKQVYVRGELANTGNVGTSGSVAR